MRLRMKQLITVLGALSLVLFFQNCGQSGSIMPQGSGGPIGDLNDGGGDPSNPNPGDPGNPPVNSTQYKDNTKFVSVNEIAEKVDILVVIDNSGSMKYEQASMANRFDSFIDQLQSLDWRVAITTTDITTNTVGTDGQLLDFSNNKFFLSKDDGVQSAKTMFGQTIQRSANGSGNEQGIHATYRALERSLQANDNNSKFLRSQAGLAVIVVTDADETPPNRVWGAKNYGDNLRNFVATTFPSKAFKFHSIIVKPGDTACRFYAGSGNEDYGEEYFKLSTNTNGIVGSVCETDYSAQLKEMGQSTAELVKNISLDCAPVDSDKDGKPDITIVDLMTQKQVTDYTVNGNQVSLVQALPIGQYKVDYRCLAK